VTGKAGVLTVKVPSSRKDISQDVDVNRRNARMIGFDQLPCQLPMIKTTNIPVNKKPREIKNQIRRVLTAGGIDEIITLSMINTKAPGQNAYASLSALHVFNPLTQDQELMRPTCCLACCRWP